VSGLFRKVPREPQEPDELGERATVWGETSTYSCARRGRASHHPRPLSC
jgi:hypothetical protein